MECMPNTAVWGKLILSVSSVELCVWHWEAEVGEVRHFSTFCHFSGCLMVLTHIGVPINDPKTPPFDIVNVPP